MASARAKEAIIAVSVTGAGAVFGGVTVFFYGMIILMSSKNSEPVSAFVEFLALSAVFCAPVLCGVGAVLAWINVAVLNPALRWSAVGLVAGAPVVGFGLLTVVAPLI